MANHTGTTPTEIILAGLPVHFSLLFTTLVAQWLHLDFSTVCGSVVEVVVTVLPLLLSLTVLSEQPERACGPLAAGAVVAFVLSQRLKKVNRNDLKKLWDINILENGHFPFLTNYRSSMLITTTICILAVDFPVFPRRFAKTENFGYGLMDLGVGSFVFGAGLVSPESRGCVAAGGGLVKCLKSCVPLLVLGMARLGMFAMTGYHDHVTEYGVHWNFFFTLAAVKILSTLCLPLVSSKLTWVLSVVLAVFYEGLLTFWLGDWIMSDVPRTDLLTANREGLCSSLGYVAIYVAGVAWGQQVAEVKASWSDLAGLGRLLVLWVFLMWGSLVYSTTFFLPPSRRQANYTFFTWIVATNLTLLTLFLAIDLLVVAAGEVRIFPLPGLVDARHRVRENHRGKGRENPPKRLPRKGDHSTSYNASHNITTKVMRTPNIYSAINYNGLAFFLLANVFTGFVNVGFRTIEIQGCSAVVILFSYIFSLCLIAIVLHRRKIRLKFW